MFYLFFYINVYTLNEKIQSPGMHKFKRNVNIKAMISGEHQKSCASNLLVSIKYLIVASSMQLLFTKQKDFS